MNPREWPHFSELPQPVKLLSGGLLLTFMLLAAAGALVWQSHSAYELHIQDAGPTTDEAAYPESNATSLKRDDIRNSGDERIESAGEDSVEWIDYTARSETATRPSLESSNLLTARFPEDSEPGSVRVQDVSSGSAAIGSDYVRDQRRRKMFTVALMLGILLLLTVVWSGVLKQFSYYFAERRHAMRAISESETINIALLSALPDTMFLIDGDGTFLDFYGQYPMRNGEVVHYVGSRLHDCFPVDIAERMHRAVGRTIETGDMNTLEYTLVESSLARHQEVRIVACGGDRVLAIVRDITERETAEQTIREAESKFRILVEQSLTGIYIVQEGRFVYVNPRFAKVFGYTTEEVLRMESPSDLIMPDDKGAIVRFEDVSEEEHGSSHYTIRGLRKDGTVIYAEVFRSVIEYNGRPAIIGTLLDVTEQRDAQEKLRVLGMAVEQSAEGVLVIDTAGIVCFVNPAWARMHGYTVEEVTGHHFRIFHTEEQLRREVFPVINRFEKTSIYRAEMGHKRKNGSTFMSSTAFASLRDGDGHVIGAVGICRDITEQKNYEAELLESKERAEELSRLKTAFLTNMSHEIRTPLTGILGFAKVLEEEVHDDQREFAQLIRVSGDRLMNTLNSILDLARLEAGEMKVNPHEVDVVEEIKEAAIVFHAMAREKQLDFQVDMPLEEIPARLDQNVLNIILNNLIGNAIKFTNEGGVTVAVDADDETIEISISDTGVGIDQSFLPHLFDEFKQESDGLTRTHEGSGLGLSITKRLVQLVDGEIEVTSAKGSGTQFSVRLPRYVDRHPLSNVA